MTSPTEPRLTSLSHGGGCGCKIAPGVLAEILKGSSGFPLPPELLVGIETADDAAVYQLNDEQALIATTDFFMPIVDDPFDFGRIAATNAISDVYAMGGKPILALALVGMPIAQLSTQTIGRILDGGAAVCRAAGIPIAGGHTIDSVEPIYGLVALGLVHPSRVKRNADAQLGDVLVLGKPLGVGVYSAALKKEQLSAEGYAAMIAATTKLNTPGPELAALDGVHALTDVTGFGLAGHALELARGAKACVEINWPKVPLLPGVRALAEAGFGRRCRCCPACAPWRRPASSPELAVATGPAMAPRWRSPPALPTSIARCSPTRRAVTEEADPRGRPARQLQRGSAARGAGAVRPAWLRGGGLHWPHQRRPGAARAWLR